MLTDGRTTDAGVTGILIAHFGAFGSGELKTGLKKEEDFFPKYMRYYAHTLQLVVRDGLDDCNQNMKRIISKATKLVAHVRKSVYSSEILESEKRLQAANATRSNSQLRMLKSVLDVLEEKPDCN